MTNWTQTNRWMLQIAASGDSPIWIDTSRVEAVYREGRKTAVRLYSGQVVYTDVTVKAVIDGMNPNKRDER